MHPPPPPPAWGRVKITEKSLLKGGEVKKIYFGGEGGYIVGGRDNFVRGGGWSRNFEVEIKTA